MDLRKQLKLILAKFMAGDKTCFMSVEIQKGVPPVGELPPETTVERRIIDSGCSQIMKPSADDIWSTTVRVDA